MGLNDLLCKDCKHSFRRWQDVISLVDKRYSLRCKLTYKEEAVQKNYVTGHEINPAHYEKCALARLNYSSKGENGSCGEEGRWWQPKNKRDLFKLIKHAEEIK